MKFNSEQILTLKEFSVGFLNVINGGTLVDSPTSVRISDCDIFDFFGGK